MEHLPVILDFVAKLAWPAVVLVIAFIFRNQVRSLLSSVKGGEVKFPGGSISLAVEKLEAAVAARSDDDTTVTQAFASVTQQVDLSHDPQLSVAAVRLNLDREIFKLLQVHDQHLSWRAWNIHTQLQTLVEKNIIKKRLMTDIEQFLTVTASLLAAPDAPSDLKTRVIAIGTSLNAEVRRLRLVRIAKTHLSMGKVFHHRASESQDVDAQKHLSMSATAAILPNLDYNYDIYREAAEDLIQVSQSYDMSAPRPLSGPVPPGWHKGFHLLGIDEFVECLAFRERELLRLTTVWETHHSYEELRKENRFHWPKEWGDLQWNTSVIRSQDPHIWEIEEDLFHTRAALNWYRTRPHNNRTNNGA